jgi:hypothetical protein
MPVNERLNILLPDAPLATNPDGGELAVANSGPHRFAHHP